MAPQCPPGALTGGLNFLYQQTQCWLFGANAAVSLQKALDYSTKYKEE